ncbi:MAG: SurA N-terminal domain-containing protein, partial [Candidatus Gastranaerophilaceae bacterium]
MKRVLITALASMFLFTGCTMNKDVIIKVNNKPITQTQFDTEFKKASSEGMLAQMGIEVPKSDDNFMYLMLKDKIVNELIVKSLLDQELNRRHIKITKNDVNNELKTMIDKVGSKEQFNELLKRNNVSNEQFMSDLKEEVKAKKLVNMIENVKISDHEAEVFYKKNQNKFTYPDKVRASHILIAANPMEIEHQIRSKTENKNESETIIKEKVAAEMNARYQKAKTIEATIKNLPDEFEKTARTKSDDVA